MARRTRAREIPRLPGAGMPGDAISRALSVPKRSVRAVAEAADERGIGWAEAEAMGDAGACEALFPEKVRDRDVYADPDWERIHGELARDGVTLERPHAEYRGALLAKGEPAMSYDGFCKRCRGFTVGKRVVGRVGHEAGRIMEADWAGPAMALVDRPRARRRGRACSSRACPSVACRGSSRPST